MSYDLGPSVIDFEFNEALAPLEKALAKVERPGSYYAAGFVDAPLFNFSVRGVGRIGLPITKAQAKELAHKGEQAPYGRGKETIVDTKVRKVWQIPPSEVQLSGKAWDNAFARILKLTCTELGCQSSDVRAELYKLLVYEKGSFFAPHRDTEKSDGMFATLSIVLPSEHAGGQLVIRHQEEENTLDLRSEDCSEIAYAAFYTDCEHEIQPLLSGTRLTLIYNLIRQTDKTHPSQTLHAPDRCADVAEVSQFLGHWKSDPEQSDKIVYFLNHYYTTAELSFDRLKGDDDAVARVLGQAARKSGFALLLAIANMEERGAAEYDGGFYPSGRSRYWDYEEDDEEEEDNDVSDSEYEAVTIDDYCREAVNWIDQNGVKAALGDIPIRDDEMLPRDALKNEKPDSQRITEATGNAGASYERAYRKAALVLWPDDQEHRVLLQGKLSSAVERLSQRVAASPGRGEENEELAAAIIDKWIHIPSYSYSPSWADSPNPSQMLRTLDSLAAAELTERFFRDIILQNYEGSENAAIATSLAGMDSHIATDLLISLFEKFTAERPAPCVELLAMLEAAAKDRARRTNLARAAHVLVDRLPTAQPPADSYPLFNHSRPFIDSDFPETLLETLDRIGGRDLVEKAVDLLLAAPNLYKPDTILAPAAGQLAPRLAQDASFQKLWGAVASFLLRRSGKPPREPEDWKQECKVSCTCSDCAELRAFAIDPVAQKRLFRVNADRREHLHHQIRAANLAMTHETERKGRPYTLICEKTRRDYLARCKQYQNDVAHLKTFVASPVSEADSLRALAEQCQSAIIAHGHWRPA